MVRYFLRISYIGTKYRGSQKLNVYPDQETIQGVVENALVTLLPAKYPATYFASRTDKGVHAMMNTLHVDLEHRIPGKVFLPHYMRNQLNSYFVKNNHEIIVTNASVVPDTFHARYHATKRSYYYRLAVLKPEISNVPFDSCLQFLPVAEINRCHIVSSKLNTSIVKRVADLYRGEHDFSYFSKYILRNPWKNTVKVIDECNFYELHDYKKMNDPQYANIDMWEFFVQSKGFLYRQVRKLVGVALSAGIGKLSLPEVENLFVDTNPNNHPSFLIPPAGGLYLANIEYDEKDFAAIDTSKSKTEDVIL